MANALEGVRIIDFTSHLSGPFCTMLLSDMGADVVKVERPGLGDESRKSAPYVNGVSAFNMQANRNKRSVVLDLKTEHGRADCQRLIDSADVVVENYKPGTMEKLGFGYEALKKRNPRLIYTAISGFGQTGPYSHRGGFDLMAQAMSGLMSICGEVNGDPLRLPIPISDLTGGMYGALGTLNALYARERTGKGQLVDVSLFESALSFSPYEVSGFFATGQRPKRIGATHRNAAPYQNYRTVDGWLALGAATQVLWLKFCDEVIKAPDLPKDPRFETNALRIQNNAALSEIVTQYLSKETTGHWLALLEKAGIPAAPVLAYDEVLNDPHFLARDQVESVEHPVAGPTKLLRTPIKFSETPVSIRRPAPTLGQHTDEVLAELNGAKKKSATR